MRTPRKAETRKSRKARTAPFQVRYDAFLQKLKSPREEIGLTQRAVSEKLGLSHTFLNKCETGERRVDVIELIQLAELYGKTPQFFLDSDWAYSAIPVHETDEASRRERNDRGGR